MEPIRLWRWQGTDEFQAKRPNIDSSTEYAALPRADFDALAAEAADARTLRAERDSLVKERDDWRDTSMAAYAAAHGLDWQSLTKEQLDAMEADAKSHGDKKAMDVVRRLYAKWNAAVYDADKVRTERDRAEREWHAATARADKAEALLREARVGLDQCACCGWSELVARIDALLEKPNG